MQIAPLTSLPDPSCRAIDIHSQIDPIKSDQNVIYCVLITSLLESEKEREIKEEVACYQTKPHGCSSHTCLPDETTST